jgi:hypothetical protein
VTDSKRPEDMTVEELLALGFTTTLREYDAECDLRDQYRAALPTEGGDDA